MKRNGAANPSETPIQYIRDEARKLLGKEEYRERNSRFWRWNGSKKSPRVDRDDGRHEVSTVPDGLYVGLEDIETEE